MLHCSERFGDMFRLDSLDSDRTSTGKHKQCPLHGSLELLKRPPKHNM